jgi:hypothetical protein
MNISLHIVYETDRGRPLTTAKTGDRELIGLAAKKAIQEAFEKACSLEKVDSFLGKVQKEEAERLQKILCVMVPEMEVSSARLGEN